MATANNRVMTDATGQEILSALQNLAAVQAVPYVASIPTGQWSGSENDWYITISASNVTANSILIPNYDKDSSELLNGPVWCIPAAGSFTIHTSAIPAGTVTIMVMFAGTMGEAQYQVLDDVYSTSQTYSKEEVYTKTETDSAITQATAKTARSDAVVTSNGSGLINLSDWLGHVIMDNAKGIILKSKTNRVCLSNAVKWSNGSWYSAVYDQLTFEILSNTQVTVDVIIFT